MEQKRGFTGYWLPREIIDHPKLTPLQKLLYGDISSFENGCFMSNATLAERYGISENAISKNISNLIKQGVVIQTAFDGRKRYLKALHVAAMEHAAMTESTPSIGANDKADPAETTSIDTNIDTRLETIDKSIGATYGSPDINEILIYWETVVGTPIMGQIKANRYAANNLIKKYGLAAVKQLVDAVARSKTDQYAPRISDFIALQRRLNDLVEWARRKNNYANIEVI